jgi:hypothetical protein
MRLPVLAMVVGAAVACSSSTSAEHSTQLTFPADAPPNGELYACWSFPRSADGWVRSIAWDVPPAGALLVHHVTLYAVPKWDKPDGAECWDMPGATGFSVWVPGVAPLELPAGMGLTIPADATRWVVQLHAYRSTAGPPAPVKATLTTLADRPAIRAAWAVVPAPVPAIAPHSGAQASGECKALADVHVGVAWPHMHRIGRQFHGAVVRAGGAIEPLVDVPHWDVGTQVAYATSVDLKAGDSVRSTCVWQNDGDATVLPGYFATDEMCHQALLVWPAESSQWTCTP